MKNKLSKFSKLKGHILPFVVISLTAGSSAYAISKDIKDPAKIRERQEETLKGLEKGASKNQGLLHQEARQKLEAEGSNGSRNFGTMDLAAVEKDFKDYAKNPTRGGRNPGEIIDMLGNSGVTVEMIQTSMRTEAKSENLPAEFLEAYSSEMARGRSPEEAYIVAVMKAKGHKTIAKTLAEIKEACKG